MKRLAAASAAILAAAFMTAAGPDAKPSPNPAPRPQAGTQRPGAPEAVFRDYLGHLRAGRPYAAIDECFDADAFAERIFGDDLAAMNDSERRYVSHLTSVLIRASVTTLPMDEFLGSATISEPRTTIKGNEAWVRFTIDDPARGVHKESTLVMRRRNGWWKIVDLDSLCEALRRDYTDARTDSISATLYLEFVTAGVLQRKQQAFARREAEARREVRRITDAAPRETDAR